MSIPRKRGKRKKKVSAAKKVVKKKVQATKRKTKRAKRPLSDVTRPRKKTKTKPHTARKPTPKPAKKKASKRSKPKTSRTPRKKPVSVKTRKKPVSVKASKKKVYAPKPVVPKKKRASKKFIKDFFAQPAVQEQVRDRIIEKLGLKALTAGFVQTPESIIQAELIAAEQLGIFERRARELAAEYNYTEREIYTLWLSPDVHFS